MNDYIIDPIIFYFMELADSINAFTLGAIIVSVVLLVVQHIVKWCAELDEDSTFRFKHNKAITVILIISITLNILVPSGEACKKMLISSLITEKNIESTKEEVKEIVDYIFEKFEQMDSREKEGDEE